MSGFTTTGNGTINLFKIATSELSQDAFIVWLLSHSFEKAEEKSVDDSDAADLAMLKECSDNMLREFLKGKISDIEKKLVLKRIDRQIDNIDILVSVEVNDVKYEIIIEDKTFTSEHDNQLEEYKKKRGECVSKDHIIGIYYKLGFQSNLRNVEKAGYTAFLIDKMLECLSPYKNKVNNKIFRDYVDYISGYKANSDYKNEKFENWQYDNYCSFYDNLQKEFSGFTLDYFEYDYVNNQSGGFCGAWFGIDKNKQNIKINDCPYEIYLQLEQKNNKKIIDEDNGGRKYLAICLKMSLDMEEDSERLEHVDSKKNRDDFIKSIEDYLGEEAGGFLAPKYVGSSLGDGKTMTVKIYKDSHSPVTEEWLNDLKSAVAVYKDLIEHFNDNPIFDD